MKCESLQFNLPLYSDDTLTAVERNGLDKHLAGCPLCRSKHAEFLALKNNLRSLSLPEIPPDLINSVKSSVAAQFKPKPKQTVFTFSESFREWLKFRLMPYGVGTVFSLIITISLLYTMLSTRQGAQKLGEVAANNAKSVVIPVSNKTPNFADDELELTKEDYAALRMPVSNESPSLNPNGALLALSKSLVRGNIKDDEVVVVADVFSNGLAQIAEVVEAPHSHKSLTELENALENDPGYAPFVPSKIDNRSDTVRVILKINRVDVVDKKSSSRKSTPN